MSLELYLGRFDVRYNQFCQAASIEKWPFRPGQREIVERSRDRYILAYINFIYTGCIRVGVLFLGQNSEKITLVLKVI